MNRAIPWSVALALVAGAVWAADEPGRSGDPASAEKLPKGAKQQKYEGPPSKEPGRSGDPASAEKEPKGKKHGKAKAATTEPGRSGDPASAEKQKKQ